ncbi:Subunit of trna-specific adenosine-34 deaminase [Globisporangium polare]
MKERLEEIVALDALDTATDADAQQRFHALEFPAQHGSAVMKYLATHFRSLVDLGFAHLKRMKKHPERKGALVALLTPFGDDGRDAQSNALVAARASEMAQLFQASVSSVYVLKHAPQTREAFDNHTRAWPLIFHASVAPEAQVEPIEDDEAQDMATHLRSALAVAQQFESVNELSKLPFCCAHGCVIVDPQRGVVADSFTNREHASYAFQPIFHPVMIAIDGVAERDRQRNDPSPKKQRREGDKDVGVAKEEAEAESYLCTDYDVFVDREPCVMCAMALVHSRARRVVFANLNASDGALASAHRLHTIKSLNHHYRVFHLRLDEKEGSE